MGLRRQRGYGSEGWSHGETYRGLNPAAFLHRARLRSILGTLSRLDLGDSGRLADFGCSDGFILEHIRSSVIPGDAWAVHGFDVNTNLLEMAERRSIPGATFGEVDLNHDVEQGDWDEQFEVVTCFESFEHMGDYRAGLRNVCRACKPGGLLVFTVPNECGLPGLAKFYGRKLIDRDPYAQFFPDRARERAYVRALLTGGELEPFREPPRKGWGPHLGFDLRSFDRFLEQSFVEPGRYQIVERRRTGMGFGRLYVLRRVGAVIQVCSGQNFET